MDWCKLSSGYYRDAALIRAGEQAEVLFLRALAYCAEHDTGGFVDGAALPFICPSKSQRRADALVSEGLWRVVDGGFTVRSWDVWQAAADILADRRRKDTERKRAARSADRARTVRGMSADVSEESPQMSGGESKKQTESKSTTDVVPATTPRRSRQLPDDFTITDGMRTWAHNEVPHLDVDQETAKFVDHFLATGKPMKDWTAAWRKWMRNATSFHPIPQQRPLRAVASTTDTRVSATLALAEKYREEGQ